MDDASLEAALKKYPRKFRNSIKALVYYHAKKEYERGRSETLKFSSNFVGQSVGSIRKLKT